MEMAGPWPTTWSVGLGSFPAGYLDSTGALALSIEDFRISNTVNRPGIDGDSILWEYGVQCRNPHRRTGPRAGTRLSFAGGLSGWSTKRSQKGERHGVVSRVAAQLGIGWQSLQNWVSQADVDNGRRGGTTTEQQRRIAALERENRDLRRANEILKAASSFFARELDPRLPKW